MTPTPTRYNPPSQNRPWWHWALGGVVVLGAVGGLAWAASAAQAQAAPIPSGGNGQVPRVAVSCVPGQEAGSFKDGSGRTWEWELSPVFLWVRSPGHTLKDAVAEFDATVTAEHKCQIVKDYFRGIGVGQ